MEIVIENYRGHEIRFNKERETFVTDIDDERSVKKSYPALKKFIDYYVKENNNFVEFRITHNPNFASSTRFNKVIGIRKDGRLIANDNQQISDYDLKDYIVYDERNDNYYDQLKSLEDEWKSFNENYRNNKKQIIDSMHLKTLKDYKKEIGV